MPQKQFDPNRPFTIITPVANPVGQPNTPIDEGVYQIPDLNLDDDDDNARSWFGSLKNFASNYWHTVNPIPLLKDLYDVTPPGVLGGNPRLTMGEKAAKANSLIKGLGDASAQNFIKAKKAYDEGRYTEAAGYTAAAIPLIGPPLAVAGEQFAEGDVSGGLGTTAGILTPFGARTGAKVLSGAAEKAAGIPAALAKTAESAANARMGRVLAPRGSKPDVTAAAAKIAPKVLRDETITGNTRAKVQASVQAAAEEANAAISSAVATLPSKKVITSAGVAKSLQNNLKSVKVKGGQFQKPVTPSGAGPTVNAIEQAVAELAEIGEVIPVPEAVKLRDSWAQLAGPGKKDGAAWGKAVDALDNQLGRQVPELKPLLERKQFVESVDRVMSAARQVDQGSNPLLRRTIEAGLGAAAGVVAGHGTLGAAVGAMLAPLVDSIAVKGGSTARVGVSRQLVKIADAIEAADGNAVKAATRAALQTVGIKPGVIEKNLAGTLDKVWEKTGDSRLMRDEKGEINFARQPDLSDNTKITERQKAIDDAMEDVNDTTMGDDTPYDETAKGRRIGREYASLDMINTILENQKKANNFPGLMKDTKFLYGEDPAKPGGISSALQARIVGDDLEVMWVASRVPGEGVKLLREALQWGKDRGAKNVKGSALNGSETLYKRMGVKTVGKENPLSGSVDLETTPIDQVLKAVPKPKSEPTGAGDPDLDRPRDPRKVGIATQKLIDKYGADWASELSRIYAKGQIEDLLEGRLDKGLGLVEPTPHSGIPESLGPDAVAGPQSAPIVRPDPQDVIARTTRERQTAIQQDAQGGYSGPERRRTDRPQGLFLPFDSHPINSIKGAVEALKSGRRKVDYGAAERLTDAELKENGLVRVVDDGSASRPKGRGRLYDVVVKEGNEKLAQQFIKAELNGDFETAGKLLGYREADLQVVRDEAMTKITGRNSAPPQKSAVDDISGLTGGRTAQAYYEDIVGDPGHFGQALDKSKVELPKDIAKSGTTVSSLEKAGFENYRIALKVPGQLDPVFGYGKSTGEALKKAFDQVRRSELTRPRKAATSDADAGLVGLSDKSQLTLSKMVFGDDSPYQPVAMWKDGRIVVKSGHGDEMFILNRNTGDVVDPTPDQLKLIKKVLKRDAWKTSDGKNKKPN